MFIKDAIRYFGFLSFVVWLICPVYANNEELPKGWRNPNPNEINQRWRDRDPKRYIVALSDFDGNGLVDKAKILIRRKDHAVGLFIFLSENGKFIAYRIDELLDSSSIEFMGIKEVAPGKYTTACGKGYWECTSEEVPKIQIKYSSINYFKIESANSFFYFDDSTKLFKRIWISD